MKHVLLTLLLALSACAAKTLPGDDGGVAVDSEAIINSETLHELAEHHHFNYHTVRVATAGFFVQTDTKLATSKNFHEYDQYRDLINYPALGDFQAVAFPLKATSKLALQDFANKMSNVIVRTENRPGVTPRFRLSDNRIVTVVLENPAIEQWSPGCGPYLYCTQKWPPCPGGSGWDCVP